MILAKFGQHVDEMMVVAVKIFRIWWSRFLIIRQNVNMATNAILYSGLTPSLKMNAASTRRRPASHHTRSLPRIINRCRFFNYFQIRVQTFENRFIHTNRVRSTVLTRWSHMLLSTRKVLFFYFLSSATVLYLYTMNATNCFSSLAD